MRRWTSMMAALLLSGCAVRYYSTSVPGPGPTHRVWVHAFVLGLVTVGEVNLDAECPSGVFKMKSDHTAVDLLISVFSLGIYTPMNLVVTCGAPLDEPAAPAP